MNLKLSGLFLVTCAFMVQSVMFAAFSSTTPALRAFGRPSQLNRSFVRIPVPESTQTKDLRWAGNLEAKMNPDLYHKIMQGAKNSEASVVELSDISNSPVVLQNNLVAIQPNMNSLMETIPSVDQLVLIAQLPLEQALNMLNARMYKFDQNIENIRAYRRYLSQNVSFNIRDLMDSKDSQFKIRNLINVDTYILKKALQERSLIEPIVENIDVYDFEIQQRIILYKDGLDFLIKFVSQVIDDNEQLLQKVSNAENVKYQNYSGQHLDELGDVPVEDPYEKVKEDVKNQFIKSGKIAAVGAGTLYGLKKLNQKDK